MTKGKERRPKGDPPTTAGLFKELKEVDPHLFAG
jgi:hypothetical protein